jgi:DNA polymerase-4
MEDLPRRIWPLPVIELFGVGPRMNRHFHRMGIRTIGDLAHADPELLQHRFGVIGRVLHQSANGIDHSPVDPHSLDENKSIGHQFTLPRDYETESDIRVVLRELAEEVAGRVRRAGAVGRTVSLTLKGIDFVSIHRSYTLPEPTNIGRVIFDGAMHLFRRHWNHTPVRLVGISLGNLEPERGLQLELFGRTVKDRQLADAIDRIRERFGTTSILYARSLTPASVFYDRTGKIGGHRK